MSEHTTLDERLAEIDERLAALQSGLDSTDDVEPFRAHDEREPRPPAELVDRSTDRELPEPPRLRPVSAAPSDGDSVSLVIRLRELSEAHERLLELHRDLLGQYAELLERRAAEAVSASVIAGPLADGAALRAFERDLRGLPGVADVSTRELLSGNRIAVDVRFATR